MHPTTASIAIGFITGAAIRMVLAKGSLNLFFDPLFPWIR